MISPTNSSTGRENARWIMMSNILPADGCFTLKSAALQPIAPLDDFELSAYGFLNRNHRMHLEDKRGKHRAELVDGYRIIAFHQHVPAPFAHADYEELNFE